MSSLVKVDNAAGHNKANALKINGQDVVLLIDDGDVTRHCEPFCRLSRTTKKTDPHPRRLLFLSFSTAQLKEQQLFDCVTAPQLYRVTTKDPKEAFRAGSLLTISTTAGHVQTFFTLRHFDAMLRASWRCFHNAPPVHLSSRARINARKV
jgi:hypothetical protein